MMFWVKFLICPIDSKNGENSRRTVLSNLIAYLQKKQKLWLQSTLPRVILGDVALVDKSMEEAVRLLQYTRRTEVAFTNESVNVRPGQQISDQTIHGSFFAFCDIGLKDGQVDSKAIVEQPTFLRVGLRYNSGMSGKETLPYWFKNKSINDTLRESIATILTSMDDNILAQRNRILITLQVPLKDKEEKTVCTNEEAQRQADANMFLSRDDAMSWKHSVSKICLEWEEKYLPMFKTLPNECQPSLLEKLMEIVVQIKLITPIHVSTITIKLNENNSLK